MSANLVTRFAPSPTGALHLGHAWSALQSHDLARAAGGQFLLRIEDIDLGRCRRAFVDGIYRDLEWLGLQWDGPVIVQSTRAAEYKAALEKLDALGIVYRCWCTRAEVAASARAPQGNVPPVYSGTCRERKDKPTSSPYCWRIDMAAATTLAGPLMWIDQFTGQVSARCAPFGDVVVARKDALSSYHLAVTVDDAASGVTDIVRGRDLFEATHIHCLLQNLLGLPTPKYHHHPLINDAAGERLAKRNRSPSLASMREAGVDPRAFVERMRLGKLPDGFALFSPSV